MNASEAAILLARISASDNREVSEASARAWADSLPDVALADALEFLPAFYRNASRETKNWIYPGDVLTGVRELFGQRSRAVAANARAAAIKGRTEDDEDVIAAGGLDLMAVRAASKAVANWRAANPMPGADIDEREARETQRELVRVRGW